MINFPGLVSIMMPVYNAELYIAQAIRSVLAQTYADWELIIVNDGSTDKSATLAARFTDPRIVLIHETNSGESVARNTALRHMRGEFVAFLDADDLYHPHHLEATVGYLQAHPDVDAVYTDGYHIDSYNNHLQTLASRRRGPFEGNIFEQVVRASDVFGPPLCVVLRRVQVEKYKLEFDPEIVIGPDWDFLTHFAEVSQFGYLDRCTCMYRIHDTNISIRTDHRRRALYLARCREKAIKLAGFNSCSMDTRSAVFYDLLVNLLTGYPPRQNAITAWSEFNNLPVEEQARLFRLMASKAALRGISKEEVNRWFKRSIELNPADRKGIFLRSLYQISPYACRLFLQARSLFQTQRFEITPFGTIERY